ncbi:hypothetical protein CEXT_135531 [Caerostris extrusa]|uniref:Uncharacterized protein n=1 Tax=Caerostris extrusa TaxID=172846 RepID=A0AAV4UKQ7_CAEEX|nr:hypothetical protein CEXT_135531 [Caerostris extrusa]
MSKAKDQLRRNIVFCLCHRISSSVRMFKGDSAGSRVGFNEPCQYRWTCQKPMTSYAGTSPFACAIEYQSSVRISKGDCPKPDDENWSTLATFVGQRSELEVNSHESIIGHCHWSAVELMAYFGFI